MRRSTWGPARTRGLLWVGATGGVLVASLLAPTAHGFPACLFRVLTGIPCASCGMTRAFIELGHGRWRGAVDHNLASPLVFALAMAFLVAALLQTIHGRERVGPFWARAQHVILPLLIGLLAVGWIRNLWRMGGA